MGVFGKLHTAVQTFLRYFCILLFIALGLILLTNVTLRTGNDLSIWLGKKGMDSAAALVKSLLPLTSMHWFDEIVELLFAYLVFYGAAALWGTKGHFSVGDWISKRLPGVRLAALYKVCVTLISAAFMAIFFYYSLRLTRNSTELSTVFQIPKAVMYSCMPVSSFIMLCYSAMELLRDLKHLVAGDEKVSGQEATSM